MDDAAPYGFTARILDGTGRPAGIGVLVAERHILTCAHVVNAALGRDELAQDQPTGAVLVDFPLTRAGELGDASQGTAERLRARVERWAPPPAADAAGDDVAGLVLIDGTAPPAGAVIARLCVEQARPGRPVRVFGCPDERPNGQWLNATVRERVGNGRFQLDSDSALRIRRGFSGSPVFDSVIGRVVGLIVMAPQRLQDPDSYAIGADQLRLVWPEVLASRKWRRQATGSQRRDDSAEVTVLHLCGTRFGAGPQPDLARLTDDLAMLATQHRLRPDLMVVTGDLTEAGRPKEFEDALEFIGALAEAAEIPRRHVAIVPGSHDVNRTACRGYFAEQEDCGARPVPPYFPKWKWFAAAIASFYGDTDMFTPDEPWTLFEMPELSVAVAGLNSTMAETHEESYGWTGETQLRWFASRLGEFRSRNWLRLAALHHDVSPGPAERCLRDATAFDRWMGRTSAVNLVLHGHTGEAGLQSLPHYLVALATGDMANGATPRRYQLITIGREGFIRYGRRYRDEQHRWAGDTAISPDRSEWFSHTRRMLTDANAAFRAAGGEREPSRGDHQPRRRLPTFFELVAEAAEARWLDASISRRPEQGYLRVSRRLPEDGVEQRLVCVAEATDDRPIERSVIDEFADGVHAAFKAADPGVPSELVYGGPPASARLEAYARERGVRLCSFTQFQGLIDLRPLADRQREELAGDRLYPARLYVEQRYRTVHRGATWEDRAGEVEVGLVGQAVEWLGAASSRLVMVLGDFGRGKTAFLKQLTRTLPSELPGVLPIFVELRGLEKAPTLDRLLVQYLADHGVEDINLGKLGYMIRSGRIALLFDGFDELELRVGYDNAADYLRTMLDSATDRAKVVITSRTQHFISTEQVRTALGARVEALSTSRVVVLEDFSQQQIIEFLAGRYDGSMARARARFELLGEMGNLLDLARNPRMLTFVADLDDNRLRAMLAERRGRISGADLYREIIDYWLTEETKRQQHPRGLRSLERDERFAACTALALRMWASGAATIGLCELSAEVSATLTGLAERGYTTEHAAHAIGSGSLLVRDDDGTFRFVHQSVMEWLVAAAAASDLNASGDSDLLAARQVSRVMAGFLADLANQDAATNWVISALHPSRPTAARQNAARITDKLHFPLAANLAGLDLRDQDMNGRDLSRADLRGASLRGMHLLHTDLSGADLSDADLRDVRMVGGSLRDATLRTSKWARAALLGTDGIDTATPELGAAAIAGRDPAEVMIRPPANPSSVAFSTDGALLAVGCGSVAAIVDTADGRTLRVLKGHSGTLERVAFLPDGTRLATASDDRTARIWDLTTGKSRKVTIDGRAIRGVAFSPDGTLLATASTDGTARIRDLTTGKSRKVTIDGRAVQYFAFSPDGTLLATASTDSTARIWDLNTGTTRTTINSAGHVIGGMAFSPDGTHLATASYDGTARIWDVATGTTRTTLTGHEDWIWGVAFSPDGTLLATASTDGTARIWDITTGAGRKVTNRGSAVQGVAFSPDGRQLATASTDGTARIWDLATGTTRTTLTGHNGGLWRVAFSPTRTELATTSEDHTACIWDLTTGKSRKLAGHKETVRGVAISTDGRLLATASIDRTARIWDLTTGESREVTGHKSVVQDVAFSPDGRLLATASYDGTARIWDVATGTSRTTLTGHDDWVWGVAFSPDGTLLATASNDRTARIWDVATGTTRTTLTGHDGWVRAVAFSTDGRLLATASIDGTARIWDVTTGGELMALLALNDEGYATLLPDGKYKLKGDPGDTLWWAIKLCRFAPGELDPFVPGLRRLEADEKILDLP
ncbi:MAG TPA: trypsin-like peptidase domain-containing protein [Streptosporangiaceae bacterium]